MKSLTDLKRKLEYLKETKEKLRTTLSESTTATFRAMVEAIGTAKTEFEAVITLVDEINGEEV